MADSTTEAESEARQALIVEAVADLAKRVLSESMNVELIGIVLITDKGMSAEVALPVGAKPSCNPAEVLADAAEKIVNLIVDPESISTN